MKIKFAYFFFGTLLMYGFTAYHSSYIGVYLSYVAIPVILGSGYMMIFYKPSKEMKISKLADEIKEENIKKKLIELEELKSRFKLLELRMTSSTSSEEMLDIMLMKNSLQWERRNLEVDIENIKKQADSIALKRYEEK